MKRPSKPIVAPALVLLLAAAAPCAGADAPAKDFYKEPPLFSTAPNTKAQLNHIARFGPVGLGFDLIQPAFTLRIAKVEKGSPAEATGRLKLGQLVETINGQKLADIDPRIQLGSIITAAEASDGVVKLMVKDTPAGAAQEVVVKIPVLGTYTKTWPLNCPKSEKIVRGLADYLAKPDSHKGIAGSGMLFLLSTGEERDLAPVKEWVQDLARKNAAGRPWHAGYAWFLGYGGVPLCEYYLRTGDPAALPVIQEAVNAAAKGEYLDAWAGRGGVPGVDYGNGHLNAGGTAVVTFLMLAKECGASVNETLLQRTLRHFFRYAGRGNNPYGDDRPEVGFVDNGKNGNLAFAMAAAASLTPDGEKSLYAAARDVCAMTGFYTTTTMLHGHTGGGIGEGWRSPAMGLLHDKKPLQYREFMDHRKWHYELSRRYTGAFGILGGDERPQGGYYDSEEFGSAYALTYTIPRKALRITGAPSKFAKTHKLPDRPWGTKADDAFLSLEAATDKNGKRADLSKETLAGHSGLPLLAMLSKPGVSEATLREYAHHQDFFIRRIAGRRAMGGSSVYLGGGGGGAGSPLVMELFASPDARIRRTALDVISTGQDPLTFLGREGFEKVIAMIKDPEESWSVKDAAILLVGRAPADWIVPHVDLLLSFLKHEEQWFQNAAVIALTPVVADERCYRKVLPAMGELLRSCQRVSTIGPFRRGALPRNLATASPAVQKLASETLKGSFAQYEGVKTAAGGQDITSVYKSHKQFLASYLAGVEGGYDVLYEIARQESPNDPLPYRDIFLAANPEKFGPKLRQAFQPIIRDSLVPEFVGKNWKTVRALAASEMKSAAPGGRGDAIDQLVDLYRKGGDTTDYDWHTFGPDRRSNEWAYFTFDPPEKKEWDSSPRYRPVTLLEQMKFWLARDFDPEKAGWKKGLAPFANVLKSTGCTAPYCGCGDTPKTLWDKEVLVMRRTFELPPMKPGHRYRLVVGGRSHVYTGDGWAVHVNGRMIAETKSMGGMGSGGLPKGAFITTEWLNDFKGSKVVVGAIAFHGPRKDKVNHFNIWFEEMKLPPVGEDLLRKSATVIPLLFAAWQEKQNPENKELQTDHDRFLHDGKFIANPKLPGKWAAVDVVASIDAFVPVDPNPADAAAKRAAATEAAKRAEAVRTRAPLKAVTFKDGGQTDAATLLWSGDMLMDLDRFQALKMTAKAIGDSDYLFIEAGGFSDKNPVGWKSPLIVMKRAAN